MPVQSTRSNPFEGVPHVSVRSGDRLRERERPWTMETTLTKKQVREFTKVFTEHGKHYSITAQVRFDDQCGNGHNTFSITGEVWEASATGKRKGSDCVTCGCIHDEITKHFPALAPLIKWHLCSTDGPMHYVENTLYHASNRDHNGLLKGEFRQHAFRGIHQNGGVVGVPNWFLELPDKRDVYSHEKPAPVTLMEALRHHWRR